MMYKKYILDWLNSIEGEEVSIDEGGLILVTECGSYLEIGGEPEEEEKTTETRMRRKIFCMASDEGTCCSETVLCIDCIDEHKDSINKPEDVLDTSFVDCSGNDAVACTICGAVGDETGFQINIIKHPVAETYTVDIDDGQMEDHVSYDSALEDALQIKKKIGKEAIIIDCGNERKE